MFRPGFLIMLGAFSVVVGCVQPFSALCIACGIACIGFGWDGLKRESKENKDE